MKIWKDDVPIQRIIDWLQQPSKREREANEEIARLQKENAELRRKLDNANDPTWGCCS